jgi:hypothetical protein
MKTWLLVRKHDGCPDVYFKGFAILWDGYGCPSEVITTCDRTEAVGFSSKKEAETFRDWNHNILWTFEAIQLGKEE